MTTRKETGSSSTPESLSDILGKDKKEDVNKETENKQADTNKKNEEDLKKEETSNRSLPVGPDNNKPNVRVEVKTNDGSAKDNETVLSDQVVATVPNKTPAELAAESPEETQARYGIDQTITDEDADNPRVQVYRDTRVNQVPSGTHLHPDIAKDMLNRGIAEQHTDNAQVKRTVTEYYDFAPDAENNDKF